MKRVTSLVIICSVFILVAAGLILLATGTWNGAKHKDSNLPDELFLPSKETEMVTHDALDSISVRSCFSRDPAHEVEPPAWLSRSVLDPLERHAAARRPIPDPAEFPGLVKVEQILSRSGNQRNHCAATRIAEHWFLTANHCVQMRGTSRTVVDMLIIAPQGDVALDDAQIIPVKAGMCHAAWYSPTGKFDDDIALLYVEDTKQLSAVDVPSLDIFEPHMPAHLLTGGVFAGWGKNGDNRFLQSGSARITEVGETFILTDNRGEFSPCVGDSGGPLYVDKEGAPHVVGVLSSVTRDGCPRYDKAFYMRLKTYADWIQTVMKVCVQDDKFVCDIVGDVWR